MIDMTKLYKNPYYAEQPTDAGGGFEYGGGQYGAQDSLEGGAPKKLSQDQWDLSGALSKEWLKQYVSPKNPWGTVQKLSWANKPYEANVKQAWYGDPYWATPGGNEMIYNPQWGWQAENNIRDLYSKASEPVTWDQFINWQLSPGDFPGFSDTPSPGSGFGGGSKGGGYDPGPLSVGGNEYGSYQSPEDWSWLGQETGMTDYPWQWNTAGSVLNQYAQGENATPDPMAWANAQNIYNQAGGAYQNLINRGGTPVSYEPAYQASKQVVQNDVEDAIKQAAEQAGLTGMRWSTPLGRSAQEIAGEKMAELGANWTTQELGALENAANRALQASSTGAGGLAGIGSGLTGLGGQQASLWEAPKQRAMEATNQLTNLGSVYGQYPLTLAEQAYQMGSGQQAMDASGLQTAYQNFLREAPENNPYLNMIFSMANASGQPTQYSQGAGNSLLGGLFSFLPFLFM